jgi:hypothetical protein
MLASLSLFLSWLSLASVLKKIKAIFIPAFLSQGTCIKSFEIDLAAVHTILQSHEFFFIQ